MNFKYPIAQAVCGSLAIYFSWYSEFPMIYLAMFYVFLTVMYSLGVELIRNKDANCTKDVTEAEN